MKASPHPCLVTSPLRGLAYGLLAKFNEAYARQEERLLADVTPNYSGKLENEQNTIRQGKKQEYQRTLKDFLKPVPSRFTDIKLTGDVELSAVELMTYFPRHCSWLEWHRRVKAGNWTSIWAARMILYARDRATTGDEKGDVDTPLTETLRTTLQHNCKNIAETGPAPGYTSASFVAPTAKAFRSKKLENTSLVSLVNGVVHRPRGEQALSLTATILHAKEHDNSDVMLSQLSSYVAEHGLTGENETAPYGLHDRQAFAEFVTMWNKYHG